MQLSQRTGCFDDSCFVGTRRGIMSSLGFIDKIGLKDHLSPTRANGLLSMVKQMKLDALALSAKIDLEQRTLNNEQQIVCLQ